MIDSPKTTLLNKLDDLDLEFIEGENELEHESIKNGLKLEILSINAFDNVENENFDVIVDDDIQKLADTFEAFQNGKLEDIKASLPWQRAFECDPRFELNER